MLKERDRTGDKLTPGEKMEMKIAFYGFEQNEAIRMFIYEHLVHS